MVKFQNRHSQKIMEAICLFLFFSVILFSHQKSNINIHIHLDKDPPGPNVFELGGTVDFLSFCPSRPRMCCLVHNPKQSKLTVPNSLHSACPQEQDLDVPIFEKESLRSDP